MPQPANNTKFSKINLLRVCDDAGDAEWDFLLAIPVGMTIAVAIKTVDAAIAKVKRAHPTDYTFENLKLELDQFGFESPVIHVTKETW